jgi:hypothetical protein
MLLPIYFQMFSCCHDLLWITITFCFLQSIAHSAYQCSRDRGRYQLRASDSQVSVSLTQVMTTVGRDASWSQSRYGMQRGRFRWCLCRNQMIQQDASYGHLTAEEYRRMEVREYIRKGDEECYQKVPSRGHVERWTNFRRHFGHVPNLLINMLPCPCPLVESAINLKANGKELKESHAKITTKICKFTELSLMCD